MIKVKIGGVLWDHSRDTSSNSKINPPPSWTYHAELFAISEVALLVVTSSGLAPIIFCLGAIIWMQLNGFNLLHQSLRPFEIKLDSGNTLFSCQPFLLTYLLHLLWAQFLYGSYDPSWNIWINPFRFASPWRCCLRSSVLSLIATCASSLACCGALSLDLFLVFAVMY